MFLFLLPNLKCVNVQEKMSEHVNLKCVQVQVRACQSHVRACTKEECESVSLMAPQTPDLYECQHSTAPTCYIVHCILEPFSICLLYIPFLSFSIYIMLPGCTMIYCDILISFILLPLLCVFAGSGLHTRLPS